MFARELPCSHRLLVLLVARLTSATNGGSNLCYSGDGYDLGSEYGSYPGLTLIGRVLCFGSCVCRLLRRLSSASACDVDGAAEITVIAATTSLWLELWLDADLRHRRQRGSSVFGFDCSWRSNRAGTSFAVCFCRALVDSSARSVPPLKLRLRL